MTRPRASLALSATENTPPCSRPCPPSPVRPAGLSALVPASAKPLPEPRDGIRARCGRVGSSACPECSGRRSAGAGAPRALGALAERGAGGARRGRGSGALLVFAGSGDYFCSGNDLTNFTSLPAGGPEEMARSSAVLLR